MLLLSFRALSNFRRNAAKINTLVYMTEEQPTFLLGA